MPFAECIRIRPSCNWWPQLPGMNFTEDRMLMATCCKAGMNLQHASSIILHPLHGNWLSKILILWHVLLFCVQTRLMDDWMMVSLERSKEKRSQSFSPDVRVNSIVAPGWDSQALDDGWLRLHQRVPKLQMFWVGNLRDWKDQCEFFKWCEQWFWY